MTFLNPLVLFGLVAAGIPVLIHLLQLKRLRQVDFSSIRFLKEIQHASARKVRLRDYLLLLVRTLAIAALVMAFARPAIKGIAGVNSKSASVLIIDNSPSTTVRNEFGKVYSQEKAAAISLLSHFHLGDYVSLLFTSDNGDTSREYSTINPKSLSTVIARSQPTDVWGGYAAAVRAGLTTLRSAGFASKDIYLVGDFQKSQFEAGSISEAQAGSPLPPNVRLFFLRTAKLPDDNLSVSNVLFPNPVVEAGVPTEVIATVDNNGISGKNDVVVSLFVDSRKVAQSVASVPAGMSEKISLSFTVTASGYHHGFVEIEDNSIQSDNKYYFSFYAMQKLNIGIVSSDTTSDFVLKAISAVSPSGDLSDSAANYATQLVTRVFSPQTFTYSNLAGLDVVVVESYSDNENFVSKITRFVEGGGGVLLFAPPISEGGPFAALCERMRLGTVTKFFSNTAGSFVGLQGIDVGDKFFSGMFSSRESADQIKNQLVTKIYSGCDVSPNPFDHVLMSTSSGPFLLGREAGSGFVFLVTSSSDTASSNFPMSPFFPVVVQRALFYSAAVRHAPVETTPGQKIEYRLATGNIKQADLLSPNGNRTEIFPKYAGGTGVFSLNGMDGLGTYSLVGNDTITEISVNVDHRASDVSQAPRSEIVAFARRLGFAEPNVFVMNATSNSGFAVEKLDVGQDLSSFFAGLALVFLILEIFISRMKAFSGRTEPGKKIGSENPAT